MAKIVIECNIFFIQCFFVQPYLMREGGEGDPLAGPGDEGGGAGRQGGGEQRASGRVAQ